MHKKKNLKQLLNLGILDYTNLTTKSGDFDMPYICCNKVPTIDYLASYSQPGTYFMTNNTAVSFLNMTCVLMGFMGYGTEFITE